MRDSSGILSVFISDPPAMANSKFFDEVVDLWELAEQPSIEAEMKERYKSMAEAMEKDFHRKAQLEL